MGTMVAGIDRRGPDDVPVLVEAREGDPLAGKFGVARVDAGVEDADAAALRLAHA